MSPADASVCLEWVHRLIPLLRASWFHSYGGSADQSSSLRLGSGGKLKTSSWGGCPYNTVRIQLLLAFC